MSVEQRCQREQCASTDLDLIVHVQFRRGELDHPQRHLQCLAIRMSHGHCESVAAAMQRLRGAGYAAVKRVVHRHTRRHGIQVLVAQYPPPLPGARRGVSAHRGPFDELAGLLDKLIARVMKMLTRSGHLVEEQGMTYLADTDADDPLASLQAASCTYRIALGPRAGRRC
jgi:hypothetical protein